MKLTFTVKPRIYTITDASSPVSAGNAAVDKINYLHSLSCGIYGKCHYSGVRKPFKSQNERVIYCYNVETFKRGKYQGKKHYIVYVYTFSLELLSELGLSVKQNTRNFKLYHK